MTDEQLSAAVPPAVAAARDALHTVTAYGGALPLPLRLAAASAAATLELRADRPYPPAAVPTTDPQLSAEAAADLLAAARRHLHAAVDLTAGVDAISCALAARELCDALTTDA